MVRENARLAVVWKIGGFLVQRQCVKGHKEMTPYCHQTSLQAYCYAQHARMLHTTEHTQFTLPVCVVCKMHVIAGHFIDSSEAHSKLIVWVLHSSTGNPKYIATKSTAMLLAFLTLLIGRTAMIRGAM